MLSTIQNQNKFKFFSYKQNTLKNNVTTKPFMGFSHNWSEMKQAHQQVQCNGTQNGPKLKLIIGLTQGL